MGKQRTVHGAYTSDSLGRDASGPLKPVEMDTRRTKAFTCADGVSLANLVDCSSNNEGLAAPIKRRGR
jgi:hypothetical protein